MAAHNELGKKGEEIAAGYLTGKGYVILSRNWRSGHREIDLIARHGEVVVFTEVKTLRQDLFGDPEEAVDARKERHLHAAAGHYMALQGVKGEIRFDIISITFNKDGGYRLDHFEDAFY